MKIFKSIGDHFSGVFGSIWNQSEVPKATAWLIFPLGGSELHPKTRKIEVSQGPFKPFMKAGAKR